MSGGKSDKRKRREKKLKRWIARAKARSGERFKEETRSLLAEAGKKVTIVEGSGPKLSGRIQKLAEPYADLAPAEESLETLFETAVIAWNMALKPEGEHAAEIEKALLDLESPTAEGVESMRQLLNVMVRRKLNLFRADRRLVVNHQVTMTRDGVNLRVVSSELPEE